jgi:coenzyme F420-0:L-glutamate ligase / coenzyme F420-1:gamma-L-glutamate ligase
MSALMESEPTVAPWRAFAAETDAGDAAGREAHALFRRRRSIRHYEARQPSDAALVRILASAAQAPSAHNRQPWRFLLVADRNDKVRLANAMGARLAADRRRDGDAEAAIAADVARSFQRITGAPIVLVVALTLADMDRYPDEDRARAEWLMAVQSTAMAGQNVLLAAAAEGLGACWMCAPLFCEPEVKRALSLPADWEIQGLVTLGYAARPAPTRPRKKLGEFVFLAAADRERQPVP